MPIPATIVVVQNTRNLIEETYFDDYECRSTDCSAYTKFVFLEIVLF